MTEKTTPQAGGYNPADHDKRCPRAMDISVRCNCGAEPAENPGVAALRSAAVAALGMCERITTQYKGIKYGVDFQALQAALERALDLHSSLTQAVAGAAAAGEDQVSLPAKWFAELLALCGPEQHELRARVMASVQRLDAAAAPARDPRDEEAWQALGFLSGLHGCMTIDPDQPMKMAEAIFEHVQGEIKQWREVAERCRAELVSLAAERGELARWKMDQAAARTAQQGAKA
jgi:hypothetical protein